MTSPISLKEAAQRTAAFDSEQCPDLNWMSAQTQESMDSLRERCLRHWSSSALFQIKIVWAVLFVLCLFLYSLYTLKTGEFVWVKGWNPAPVSSDHPGFVTTWLINSTASIFPIGFFLAGPIIILRVLIFALTDGFHVEFLLKQLRPMSLSPKDCKETLDLLSLSPSAQEYRGRVLSSGREMVKADQQAIQVLARSDESSADHCQLLHGIA